MTSSLLIFYFETFNLLFILSSIFFSSPTSYCSPLDVWINIYIIFIYFQVIITLSISLFANSNLSISSEWVSINFSCNKSYFFAHPVLFYWLWNIFYLVGYGDTFNSHAYLFTLSYDTFLSLRITLTFEDLALPILKVG